MMFTFVVVGGGIAGVSCAEALRSYSPTSKVILLTSSPLIKAVRNVKDYSRTLTSFDVQETPVKVFSEQLDDNFFVDHCNVLQIDHKNKRVKTSKGVVAYDKLCVCTGAKPKLVFGDDQHVIGIRDTATAKDLDKQLMDCQRVVVVGNGGIATELVFELKNCEIIWAVRDKSIGQVFFDPGAAEFFLSFLNKSKPTEATEKLNPVKRMNYRLTQGGNDGCVLGDEKGAALGPDWHQFLHLKGKSCKSVQVQYNCEVKAVYGSSSKFVVDQKLIDINQWPVYVELTNGKIFGCDLMVSATGVVPNTDIFSGCPCTISSKDTGVEVDQNMRVLGMHDVYAAGDVCSTTKWPKSSHWFQMRLWTQARQMGIFAARCMVGHLDSPEEEVMTDICFDLFAHMTRFFGKKVCLLGRYNAQELDTSDQDLELFVRTSPLEEYIKVVMLNGRIQGAVLIGETDLEETFENLILNETDVGYLGDSLLDPNIDITDYFD